MGALLEMEVWSALMTLVCPVPKVHGGSAEITSSGCFRQILKKMWQSRCLLQMRCAVWNEWIFSSNTPEDKTCQRQRRWWDALCVKTRWGFYFNTNRRQLTTCTKARAKRYLRWRWAISSQFASSSKWMSASVVCKNIPKRCRRKLKKVSSLWTLWSSRRLLNPSSSFFLFFFSWFFFFFFCVLCSVLHLFWFWCVKTRWGVLYPLMLRVTGTRGGAGSDLRGAARLRGGLPGDLDNPHYTWSGSLIGICIRSWRWTDMFSMTAWI